MQVAPFLHGLLVQLSEFSEFIRVFNRFSIARKRRLTYPTRESAVTLRRRFSKRINRLMTPRFGVPTFIEFIRVSNWFSRRPMFDGSETLPVGRIKLITLMSLILTQLRPINRNVMLRSTADSITKFPSSVKNFGLRGWEEFHFNQITFENGMEFMIECLLIIEKSMAISQPENHRNYYSDEHSRHSNSFTIFQRFHAIFNLHSAKKGKIISFSESRALQGAFHTIELTHQLLNTPFFETNRI